VIDVIGAGWFALNAAVNASKSDNEIQGGASTRDAAVSIGISLVALEVASAVTGFSRTKACKEAMGDVEPPRYSPPSQRANLRPTPWSVHSTPPAATPPRTANVITTIPVEQDEPPAAMGAAPPPTSASAHASGPAIGATSTPTAVPAAMATPSPAVPVRQQRDDDDP